jgi:hypothetical protein
LELVAVEPDRDLVVETMDRLLGSTHTKHGVVEAVVPTVGITASRPREETAVLVEEQVRQVTRGSMAVTVLKQATRATKREQRQYLPSGTEEVTST